MGRKRMKVEPNLLERLERIGDIKNGFPLLERGACNLLGLYVQHQLILDGPPVETLQAGYQTTSYLDTWKAAFTDDWKVEKYEPGEWETLVEPTWRLAEWLNDWGGLYEENIPACKIAIAMFKQTGQLGLALSNERAR